MANNGGKGARARYRAGRSRRQWQRWIADHPEETAQMRALAEEVLADQERCRQVALWVGDHCRDHEGRGPSWKRIALHARPDMPQLAPDRFRAYVLTNHLLPGLQAQGWLVTGPRAHSTQPGPRLDQEASPPAVAPAPSSAAVA